MVLIAAGAAGGTLTASAEIFNPVTGIFSNTGSLALARDHQSATRLNNGKVLIAGGFVPTFNMPPTRTAEIYDPSTGMFTSAGQMAIARVDHTATLLNNGTVLIVGGEPSSAIAEIFNPGTGSFSSTGSMSVPRTYPMATLLNNGTVLVVGGEGTTPNRAQGELFNPSSGTFSLTGILNAGRSLATAILLGNGNVLLAGGQSVNLTGILSTAELYQPTSLVPAGLISITIALSPPFPWVPIGSTYNLQALGTFSGNTVETLASAKWTSSSGTISTITNDSGNFGHAFGLATGTSTVEACTGTVCGSTALSVAPHSNTIIGSESGDGSSATFETYDDNGNPLETGNLTVSRSNHSATLLTDGTIFIAGGVEAPGSWQILDVNGQLAFSGSLQTGFYSHFAVRLANGNVFLGGGVPAPGAWEIHNSTGAFVSSGTLLGKRTAGAGAVALPDGNIWISGSGAAFRSDECSWEIHDVNGNLVSNGTLNTCFASGKIFVLANGDIILLGGVNAPGSYEIRTQTGSFVRSGTLINGFDANSGGSIVNNDVFLFESGFWEFIGFDSNSNTTFDTTGTLMNSRLGARAVVTSTGRIFISGGNAAPSTWEMWTPSGSTMIFFKQGTFLDTHYGGHSDTHF